jgi:hypothetical protein
MSKVPKVMKKRSLMMALLTRPTRKRLTRTPRRRRSLTQRRPSLSFSRSLTL